MVFRPTGDSFVSPESVSPGDSYQLIIRLAQLGDKKVD